MLPKSCGIVDHIESWILDEDNISEDHEASVDSGEDDEGKQITGASFLDSIANKVDLDTKNEREHQ